MAAEQTNKRKSAFDGGSLKQIIKSLVEEIQVLYQADDVPWIVGYSGGKDSTACLQLIWLALRSLPPDRRHKPIHVISTDTLVENPVVAAWVTHSLEAMKKSACDEQLPVEPHRLTPSVNDSFWVNLIGRGYPAPRPRFRWCTERLKINPSNAFITGVVAESGEAILVLGTRKAESQARARSMQRLEAQRVRERLSPNAALANCLVYSPIEDWANDDVWLFLMQSQNPWGYDNKALLTMYQGASQDGECPLVIDTTTPSCGDSRFGCWVCTLVDEDKSMRAMIQNDEEKEWMLPLLALRNKLDQPNDRQIRDFRRMSGLVQIFHNDPIPGPYTQKARANWLREVLRAQSAIRKNPGTPEPVRDIELITLNELREIRRIWVIDKHEIEDFLPQIYQIETGEVFTDAAALESSPWGPDEFEVLRAVCGPDNELQYQMIRELLHVEQRYRTASRRAGLYEALEDAIRRSFYDNEEDAVELARKRHNALKAHKETPSRFRINEHHPEEAAELEGSVIDAR
jgi:DNA sulfur modification protein DndC